MARPRNPDEIKLEGFKAGQNNVAPHTKPPRDEFGTVLSVVEAVNVDFDSAGRARRRRGQVVEDPRAAKSGIEFAGYLIAHVEQSLRAYTWNGASLVDEGEIVAGVGDWPVSFATDDFDLYWSSRAGCGRIDGMLTAHPMWIATPDPASATASAAGGLGPGMYAVSVTAVDGEGTESGASAPVVVVVPAGGGITVTLPAAPAGATKWRVYASGADGELLRFCAEHPIAATTASIGAGLRGDEIKTAWLYPMPACDVLRYAHGRLYGLTGNVLYWSEAYRLGLTHADNCIVLGNEATLLEPMETGLYVADHKRTYWFSGTDPGDWKEQRIVHPHPAAPGGSQIMASSWFGGDSENPVAVWASAAGAFCLGGENGDVKVLRSNAFVFNRDAERAALGAFEFDGVRQLVMSAMGGSPHIRASAVDTVDVQIRRNGVVLS